MMSVGNGSACLSPRSTRRIPRHTISGKQEQTHGGLLSLGTPITIQKSFTSSTAIIRIIAVEDVKDFWIVIGVPKLNRPPCVCSCFPDIVCRGIRRVERGDKQAEPLPTLIISHPNDGRVHVDVFKTPSDLLTYPNWFAALGHLIDATARTKEVNRPIRTAFANRPPPGASH